MKLNTNKEVWIARIVAWVILGGLAFAIIFAGTFMVGPSLFVIPNFSENIAVAVFCPGAESNSKQEGASGPTTSDPNGTQGHTVEITCYYADGSEKIINNGQYAIASIVGAFGIGGLCGIGLSIPLMLLPFFLIRKKKSEI